MDGMRFPVPVHGHGTLAADIVQHVKLPCGATLVQVDAVATTAAVGTVKVGTDADDDAYLTASAVGASNVPKSYGRTSFVGGDYPHIAKDTVLKVTVAHASMINADIMLWFLEG